MPLDGYWSPLLNLRFFMFVQTLYSWTSETSGVERVAFLFCLQLQVRCQELLVWKDKRELQGCWISCLRVPRVVNPWLWGVLSSWFVSFGVCVLLVTVQGVIIKLWHLAQHRRHSGNLVWQQWVKGFYSTQTEEKWDCWTNELVKPDISWVSWILDC